MRSQLTVSLSSPPFAPCLPPKSPEAGQLRARADFEPLRFYWLPCLSMSVPERVPYPPHFQVFSYFRMIRILTS